MSAVRVTVDGEQVRLSNLAKVLYPAAGTTKAEVIDYYARIAPVMVPHLAGHPVSLKRFPDGVGGESFFEKNCPAHRPGWVGTFPLGSTRPVKLCLVERTATLVWLANLAALEIHPYLWTTATPQTPSMVVFDLDPGPGAGMTECALVALRLRGMLERLGLMSLVKTSGGKGLHLMVPLNTPGVSFEQTKSFARAVALALERDDPAGVTTSMAKGRREGRVFIDWSQNDRHKTTAGVYSLRGRERPTVSTPVGWDEVERAALGRAGLVFEAQAVLERVERLGDVAAPVLELRQRMLAMG